jgi:hypothetical protein
VIVTNIIDAATFELADGRHVRLAGVVVRGPGQCGGPEALTDTQQHVTVGQPVNMVQEPGDPKDRFGSLWVYIQGDTDRWNMDVGTVLAMGGEADLLPDSGANPAYTAELADWVSGAKSGHSGQWGPPCGPPDPDDSPADSGSGSSVHVDEDHHHHNMPDGLLTGGFCRHHRWC